LSDDEQLRSRIIESFFDGNKWTAKDARMQDYISQGPASAEGSITDEYLDGYTYEPTVCKASNFRYSPKPKRKQNSNEDEKDDENEELQQALIESLKGFSANSKGNQTKHSLQGKGKLKE
jgi:hypothetical protein